MDNKKITLRQTITDKSGNKEVKTISTYTDEAILASETNINEKISNLETNVENNASKISANTAEIESLKASVNTGTFDPTSDNPAGQKSIADYYGQGGQGITSFENITDKNGHKRFQEWDGAVHIAFASKNPTINYLKCSLSGSHMMFVACFSLKYVEGGNNNIVGGSWLFVYTLPKWICDKIITLYSDGDLGTISYRNIEMIQHGELLSGDHKFRLSKFNDNQILVANAPGGNLSYTADTTFRVQFDLIIDNA